MYKYEDYIPDLNDKDTFQNMSKIMSGIKALKGLDFTMGGATRLAYIPCGWEAMGYIDHLVKMEMIEETTCGCGCAAQHRVFKATFRL